VNAKEHEHHQDDPPALFSRSMSRGRKSGRFRTSWHGPPRPQLQLRRTIACCDRSTLINTVQYPLRIRPEYEDQFGVLSGIITQHNITDPANNESDYRFQDEGKYDSCGICSNRCKKPNQKQE
jgi:hypothetical protein